LHHRDHWGSKQWGFGRSLDIASDEYTIKEMLNLFSDIMNLEK